MIMLESLDDRLLKWMDQLRADGQEEKADQVGSSLAYLREAWRGADRHGSDLDDLQVVAENAATLLAILEESLPGGLRA